MTTRRIDWQVEYVTNGELSFGPHPHMGNGPIDPADYDSGEQMLTYWADMLNEGLGVPRYIRAGQFIGAEWSEEVDGQKCRAYAHLTGFTKDELARLRELTAR